MKKILITGAIGQDGCLLSQLYLKRKFKVFGFIKKNHKKKIKGVHYKINDLTSFQKIFNDIKKIKPDIIIHLASFNMSFSSRKKSSSYRIDYLQNLQTTKNLVNAILKNNLYVRFIFAGSSLMFNKNLKKRVSEKDRFSGREYYGKYKIDSSYFLDDINKKNKINSTTAILFNHDSIYRDKKFLIPKLISLFKNKNKKFIEKIYKLNISGDFSHAEDICKGIYNLSLSKKKIEKIILSSGKRFYLNKIILFLEDYFNLKITKKILSNNLNKNIVGSNNLAKRLINYKIKKNSLIACKEMLKKNYQNY